jgi:hypothetical protein
MTRRGSPTRTQPACKSRQLDRGCALPWLNPHPRQDVFQSVPRVRLSKTSQTISVKDPLIGRSNTWAVLALIVLCCQGALTKCRRKHCCGLLDGPQDEVASGTALRGTGWVPEADFLPVRASGVRNVPLPYGGTRKWGPSQCRKLSPPHTFVQLVRRMCAQIASEIEPASCAY